jgi:hypothetical protein
MPTNFVELADGVIGIEAIGPDDPTCRKRAIRLTVESGPGLAEDEVRAIVAIVNERAATLGIGPIRWSAS